MFRSSAPFIACLTTGLFRWPVLSSQHMYHPQTPEPPCPSKCPYKPLTNSESQHLQTTSSGRAARTSTSARFRLVCVHGQTPALAGDVDVNKSRPAMSSRLITIGCLQMGKARRSGNLHLNPFRPIPTLTNPQHGARPKEASWTIGFPGSSHQQLLFNLHCAAPQSYCKFFGNGFSVAPVNELYDTDASGYLCPGRSTRVGPNLFYLILPAKKILLCSACRSPKTCKLGLEHTAIVRDTPVATARMPLAV